MKENPTLRDIHILHGSIYAMLNDQEKATVDFYCAQGRKYGVAISLTNETTREELEAAHSKEEADHILQSNNTIVGVQLSDEASELIKKENESVIESLVEKEIRANADKNMKAIKNAITPGLIATAMCFLVIIGMNYLMITYAEKIPFVPFDMVKVAQLRADVWGFMLEPWTVIVSLVASVVIGGGFIWGTRISTLPSHREATLVAMYKYNLISRAEYLQNEYRQGVISDE
ncbi:TPA: hypothetical protein ACGSTL_001225 [Vibrio parahaemolyticus]|uniref:hypothetical protein n=1 Tax=Vibrio campbellii TaxID=680 RepID=UPI001F07C8F9|nr:hypothetical protein [Vibrio campbellii]UMM06644.1 hypothetical protein MKR81_27235 [Vibrio campbellii]